MKTLGEYTSIMFAAESRVAPLIVMAGCNSEGKKSRVSLAESVLQISNIHESKVNKHECIK